MADWGSARLTCETQESSILSLCTNFIRGDIMDWLTGSGIIRYDPPRPGLSKKKDWWAIVEIDREITRYYRWWVQRRFHVELKQPSWDAHISIIRGEKPHPDKMNLWKKYNGKRIEFKYSNYIRQSGDTKPGPNSFWFVEVDCPFLTEMRDEFNIPSDWKQHITIGRTWYDIGNVCPIDAK